MKEKRTAYATGKTSLYDLLKLERNRGYRTKDAPARTKANMDAEKSYRRWKAIEKQKDITIAELKEKLGLSVSESTIRTMIHEQLGYRFLKNSTCERARATWCSCQKVSGVAQLFEAAEVIPLYLPPYSPDLSPIELMWSKVKAYLR